MNAPIARKRGDEFTDENRPALGPPVAPLLTSEQATTVRAGGRVLIVPGDVRVSTALEDMISPILPGTHVVAPQGWVDCDQPCDPCKGRGGYRRQSFGNSGHGKWVPCPDPSCRGGRRLHELYGPAENHGAFNDLNVDVGDTWTSADGVTWLRSDEGWHRLVARATIQVVPVVDFDDWQIAATPIPCVTIDGYGNAVHMTEANEDDGGWGTPVTLDPLPVPGRDWAVVLSDVEMAS